MKGHHLHLLALVAAEIATAVEAARHAEGLQVETAQYEEYVGHNHGLVGKSPAITALREEIERVAKIPSTVLSRPSAASSSSLGRVPA